VTERKPLLRLKRPRTGDRVPRARGRRVVPLVRRPTEDDLLADLQALAPEVWDPDKPAPLAVGIHTQINPVAESRGLSRRAVRRFLGRWTSRESYLAALQPGAQRVNIDGTPSEPVLDRHGERARQRLARRQAQCAGGAVVRRPERGPDRPQLG
jgi:sRNA-binding protein